MVGKPIVIGLLGGIASGKSTVAGLLAGLGAKVVDADRIAHEVLWDQDVAAAIAAEFGAEVLDETGRPDRRRLGDAVFDDPGKLERLEAIVHPRVRERMEEEIAAAFSAGIRAVVLDVPLLLESELTGITDTLVHVRASREARDRRAAANRGWSRGEVERREHRQTPVDEKQRRADHVIENEGSLEDLELRVRELWKLLTKEG
jgi:dephospho-CoA kinase